MFGISLKKLLKAGLILFGLAACPWLVIAGGAAYLGLKATRKMADMVRNTRDAYRSIFGVNNEDSQSESQSRKRGALYLADGMSIEGRASDIPVKRGAKGWEISVDGIPGLVFATSPTSKESSRFFVRLDGGGDRAKAEAFSAGRPKSDGAKIVSHDGGNFLSLSNPEAAGEFARSLFTKKDMDVTENVYEVNQYRVSGCSSYEEAARRVKEAGGSLIPDACFVGRDYIVDGRQAGSRFRPEQPSGALRPGEYIVNETRKHTRSARISAPIKNGETIDLEETALRHFPTASLAIEPRTSGPELSDGAENARRMIELPVNLSLRGESLSESVRGSEIRLVGTDRFLAEYGGKAYANVSFRDRASLDRFLADGIVRDGTSVTLTNGAPAEGVSPFTASVPLDAGIFNVLSTAGRVAGAVVDRYSGTGLSESDVEASIAASQLAMGAASFVMNGDRDILSGRKAFINGVPAPDVRECAAEGIFDGMPDAKVREWMAEASRIQFARVFTDSERQCLVVESQVQQQNGGSVYKRMEKTLDPADLSDPAYLKAFSSARAKDILMKLDRDAFSTYSSSPRQSVKDIFSGMKAQQAKSQSSGQSQSRRRQTGVPAHSRHMS